MEKNIAVIKGDGIGPEIVTEAMKVLDKVAAKYGHKFNYEVLDRVGQVYGHSFSYTEILMGGCSIDANGVPLTDETIGRCKDSDAVLMGSIGGDTTKSPWYKLPANLRPEAGLLKIRKSLGLFANLRPCLLFSELASACPLKTEISEKGFDMLIMRELTGGLYFGERHTGEVDGVVTAVDTLSYNEKEIRRIAVKAFDVAMKRRKKVTSVDKANVLDSSRLWRKVVEEVAKDYPEVKLEHMLDAGNTAYAPNNVSIFPLVNGEPDFSARQEPEREEVSATRQAYIAWNQLVTNNNLSAEETYQYRRDVFSLLPDMDWGELGQMGSAENPDDAIFGLMTWLENQPPYSSAEILWVLMGCTAQGLDGAYAERYADLLARALFSDPVVFARALATEGVDAQTKYLAISNTSYGADLYPAELNTTLNTLDGYMSVFTDAERGWAELLRLYLATPVNERNQLPDSPAGLSQ